ncbi:MAG: hypothetical protein MI919_30755, partial [Holophagales bacterium]|nr:hypothetical protein [Holophagales bacterium]
MQDSRTISAVSPQSTPSGSVRALSRHLSFPESREGRKEQPQPGGEIKPSLTAGMGWPGKIGLYILAWTLLGLYFGSWMVASALINDAPVAWSHVLSELLSWYVWALLTPFIWWTAHRFPLERPHLLRRLSINLLIGIGLTFVVAYLSLIRREVVNSVWVALSGGAWLFSYPSDWNQLIFWGLEYNLVVYFGIMATIQA